MHGHTRNSIQTKSFILAMLDNVSYETFEVSVVYHGPSFMTYHHQFLSSPAETGGIISTIYPDRHANLQTSKHIKFLWTFYGFSNTCNDLPWSRYKDVSEIFVSQLLTCWDIWIWSSSFLLFG